MNNLEIAQRLLALCDEGRLRDSKTEHGYTAEAWSIIEEAAANVHVEIVLDKIRKNLDGEE